MYFTSLGMSHDSSGNTCTTEGIQIVYIHEIFIKVVSTSQYLSFSTVDRFHYESISWCGGRNYVVYLQRCDFSFHLVI